MSSVNIGEVFIFLIGVEVVPEMQHFLHWNVLRKHWRKAWSFKTVEKSFRNAIVSALEFHPIRLEKPHLLKGLK
jgi:hypothetical protein